MKKPLFFSCIALAFPMLAIAQLKLNLPDPLYAKDQKLVNESHFVNKSLDSATTEEFKPSVSVGSIMHAYYEMSQSRTVAGDPSEGDWSRSFVLYRARVLVGAQLSRKGSFFMETEIPNTMGNGGGGAPKGIKVAPIILDFQYEHVFNKYFSIIAGKQLVSNNRNGLQGAASLLANDFTHYQYAYNMFEGDPLQGNFGRDMGVNTRGFLADERLEYRLGVFSGRRFPGQSPLRVVGRLQYSLLEKEKDFYYAGTKLGSAKTLTFATGIDAQADYMNLSVDGYLDIPVGNAGAITANAAFAYMDGGKSTPDIPAKSFGLMIPKQTVQFLELGYYFKNLKIQPWIKYENQIINEDRTFYGLANDAPAADLENSNLLMSNMRLGGGVNYWFNGYNTNLRISYTDAIAHRVNLAGDGVERKGTGQIWVQLQLFFF